jgi:hypothetical protein
MSTAPAFSLLLPPRPRESDMVEAIKARDMVTLRNLIESGDQDPTENRNAALERAVLTSNPEAVRMLLGWERDGRFVDPRHVGRGRTTLLQLVMALGTPGSPQTQLVQLLLDWERDGGTTYLDVTEEPWILARAIGLGNVELVRHLLAWEREGKYIDPTFLMEPLGSTALSHVARAHVGLEEAQTMAEILLNWERTVNASRLHVPAELSADDELHAFHPEIVEMVRQERVSRVVWSLLRAAWIGASVTAPDPRRRRDDQDDQDDQEDQEDQLESL